MHFPNFKQSLTTQKKFLTSRNGSRKDQKLITEKWDRSLSYDAFELPTAFLPSDIDIAATMQKIKIYNFVVIILSYGESIQNV